MAEEIKKGNVMRTEKELRKKVVQLENNLAELKEIQNKGFFMNDRDKELINCELDALKWVLNE